MKFNKIQQFRLTDSKFGDYHDLISCLIMLTLICRYAGAYLGFCQGGCTFLADLPPPPDLDPDPDPHPHQDFEHQNNADPQPWGRPKNMWIHRIHMFLGLPDPDPLVRGIDPDLDPALDPNPDPSFIMQK